VDDGQLVWIDALVGLRRQCAPAGRHHHVVAHDRLGGHLDAVVGDGVHEVALDDVQPEAVGAVDQDARVVGADHDVVADHVGVRSLLELDAVALRAAGVVAEVPLDERVVHAAHGVVAAEVEALPSARRVEHLVFRKGHEPVVVRRAVHRQTHVAGVVDLEILDRPVVGGAEPDAVGSAVDLDAAQRVVAAGEVEHVLRRVAGQHRTRARSGLHHDGRDGRPDPRIVDEAGTHVRPGVDGDRVSRDKRGEQAPEVVGRSDVVVRGGGDAGQQASHDRAVHGG
jgi:hypothetical protein